MNEIIEQIKKLTNNGYEDLTISPNKLVEFIKSVGHEFPLNVNGKKVWIHIHEVDGIIFETDIGENTIKLKI